MGEPVFNDNAKKQLFSDSLRQRILSGELKPGDRLPSERELAQQYGLSRGSINQGILDLERAGFLRVVPRKGTFIADYVNEGSIDILSSVMSLNSPTIDRSLFADFMAMRILIERECARLACTRDGKETAALLTKAASELFDSSLENIPTAMYRYHLAMVTASGNAAYVMIFRSFEPLIKTMIAKHFVSEEELQNDLRLYSELTVALIYRDAAKADGLLTEILTEASEYLNRV